MKERRPVGTLKSRPSSVGGGIGGHDPQSSKQNIYLDLLTKLLPGILTLALVIWIVIRFDEPIRRVIIPRITNIEVLGIKLKMAEQSLDDLTRSGKLRTAAKIDETSIPLSQTDKEQIFARLKLVSPAVQGRRVLWVDDNPNRNIRERNFFQSIGLYIDDAQDNHTALLLIEGQKYYGTPYDLIISDIGRDNNPNESGLKFLDELSDRGDETPLIYYTGHNQEKPAGAFALTTYSADLINCVFDLIERLPPSKESPATR